MNTLRFIAVATVAFAAGGAAVYFLRPAPVPIATEVARTTDGAAVEQAPPPRAAKRTVIPRSEISTTGREWREGFAWLVPPPEPRYEMAENELRQLGTQIGSANVFLVPGFLSADVPVSAGMALQSGSPASFVYRHRDSHAWRDRDDKPAPLWVFVMLEPRVGPWNVHDVVCEANRIRVNYSMAPPSPISFGNIVPYLYWFRLPTPEREEYLFELFDCDKGEVMLSRRQFVKPARPPQPPPPFDPNSAK